MLTGAVPHGVFDPPSKKAPVDARLDPVVLRAMEEAPERRYQQAGDLRDDMDRAAEPVPRQRRRRAAWGALVSALLVASAIAFLIFPRGRRAAQHTPAPVAPAARLRFTRSSRR